MDVISVIYPFRLWNALLKVICLHLKKVSYSFRFFVVLYFIVLYVSWCSRLHD